MVNPKTKKQPDKKKESEAIDKDENEAIRAIEKVTAEKPEKVLVRSLEDLKLFSKAVAMSGYFPDIKSAAQAFLRIKVGMELGLPEMASLRAVHYLEKSKDFVIGTSVLAAIAMDRGIRYKILTPPEKRDEECEVQVYKPGSDIPPVTVKFGREDAKRAGLLGKANYQMYPRQMFFKRSLKFALNEFDPRIDMGYYSREEMEDAVPFSEVQAEIVDVKPKKRQREPGDDDDLVSGPGGNMYSKKMPAETGPDEAAPWEQEEEKPPHPAEPSPPSEEPRGEIDDEVRFKESYIQGVSGYYLALGGVFGLDGQYDIRRFKQWLSEKQTKRIYVAKNQFGHLSFHLGKVEDLKYLSENINKIFNKFLDDMGIDIFGNPIKKKQED